MLLETKILNLKNIYFNSLLFNNRCLFYNNNDNIDVDKLIDIFNYTYSRNRLLKREYQLYRVKRNQLIKKFNQDTIKLNYNEIESVLRSYFCADIKNLILEFITSYKPKIKIYS